MAEFQKKFIEKGSPISFLIECALETRHKYPLVALNIGQVSTFSPSRLSIFELQLATKSLKCNLFRFLQVAAKVLLDEALKFMEDEFEGLDEDERVDNPPRQG